MEDRIEAPAAEAGVEDFNPRSTPQVIAALKARGADLSYMSQKDGKLSADKGEPLRLSTTSWLRRSWSSARVQGAVHLRAAVHPSSLLTQLRAWKEAFVAPDGRIHATYRQIETRTGRMSCADPNIQNQPRDDLRLRYNVRAEPGMKLVGADLSNIEMRIFAYYAGDGALIDAVRNNKDIHTMTAEALGITDRERAGGFIESARQRGKTFNFDHLRRRHPHDPDASSGARRTTRSCSSVGTSTPTRGQAPPEPHRVHPPRPRLYPDGVGPVHARGPARRLQGGQLPRPGHVGGDPQDALIACHAEGLPVIGLIHDEILRHCPEDEAEYVKERLEFH